MTVPGLTPPRLSEADPDTHGEGSINQLGLATLADRLADELASREVTARMTRIRWVTAIAVGATVCEGVQHLPSGDGVTPAYLAYEWLVVEAIARRESHLGASALQMVPGIDKARAVLSRNWGHHLDATHYLKTPKVFGFTGIFRTLAEGLDVVDRDGLLTPRGEELVRAWEAAEGLEGFLDRAPGTPGAHLARRLERAVGDALLAGRVMVGPQSHLWTPVAQMLRPDNARRQERRLLWGWLTDPHDPAAEMRRESLHQLLSVEWTGSEREALTRILKAKRLSAELAARIRAVVSYERFASLLHQALDRIRWRSTSQGIAPVTPGHLNADDHLARLASDLPASWEQARVRLERVDLQDELALPFAPFAEEMSAGDLSDAVLAHHERIQASKPPAGKRPWFSRYPDGVVVRPGYSLIDMPEPASEYIHPYRITALRRFIDDLRPWELGG